MVPFQSLKSKIAANLALIILITTLLSYVVVIHVVQKNLIQSGVEKGRWLMAAWPLPVAPDNAGEDMAMAAALDGALRNASFIYASFFSASGQELGRGTVPDNLEDAFRRHAARSLKTRQPSLGFGGDTWGILWHQRRYALISEPSLDAAGRFAGVNTLVLDLDDMYETLRRSQNIIGLYMGANFLVLLMLGTYRLSRLVIRPIHKFIKMTDDYRDKDRLYFAPGRRFQEFNQLSKALNQMIEKIERNKENLQDAFHRLEQANRDLKNAQDEIIKAEKLASIGRLSAGIAHEIGNPIGIVLGYIDLLKSRPGLKTDETARDYLFRAGDEVERVHGIIRQLLDFSRAAPLCFECISMHELVNDVVDIMSHQPLMRQVAIECRLLAENHRVMADYQQMRQVLVNLMINAADAIQGAGADKGKITLETESIGHDDPRAEKGGPVFLLRITDDGVGIAPQDIDNIFDPFYTTKAPGKGTGLGLSVSYMIVEQTGGAITVESDTETGARFTISLPLVPEKEVD